MKAVHVLRVFKRTIVIVLIIIAGFFVYKLINQHFMLNLKCKAAICVNIDSNTTLYEKNIHKQLYPASLTKLMTALILTESDKSNARLTYTSSAKSQPSNKLDFQKGSTLTAENTLRGMLIFSANDMAAMVADNVSGSTEKFADRMNEKAKALGMNDTHFANANGLQNENHYMSAYDLSLLAKAVYRNDKIMKCLETPSAVISTTGGKSVKVYNTNKTLRKNGCFAGKTGYTGAAGHCLAAFYKKNGKVILGIILGAPDENSLYSSMNDMINAVA